MLILSLIPVSAYYVGETITIPHNLNTDKINWLIVDNEIAITILPEITFNYTNIIIYFPSNMPPNSFTLVFIEKQTNEVIVEVPVSSGSSSSGSTKTIYKNNTVYLTNDKYIIKEVPIINETIKTITEEKIIKVNKIWKDYLIAGLIVLSLILFIWLISTWK